jgi:hypothetical protein
MRPRAAAVAVVLALVAGRSAAAEEPIAFLAPSGCPDADAFRADVARLGGLPRADLPAVVNVTGRWSATITIGERHKVRTISAKSCGALAEAAALVVAMALRDAPPPQPEPEPEPEIVTPPAPAPAPITKEAPPRAVRRSALAVGVGLHGITGALPAAAPGVGAWVAWLPPGARLELSGYATAREDALAPNAPLGAELQLLGGSVRACWIPLASRRIDLGPCAALEGARIASTGVGITAPRDAVTWEAAGSAGALAAIHVERPFSITLAADAIVPTARPRFVLDGDPLTVLHRPSAVWGRVVLGGEVRF